FRLSLRPSCCHKSVIWRTPNCYSSFLDGDVGHDTIFVVRTELNQGKKLKMKIKNLVIRSVISLFSAALLAVSAHAQTSNYNDMDALFGFRVLSGTGATLDVVIDLGPVSQFNHTFSISLGSGFTTFMSTNFGADWFTRLDITNNQFTAIQWAVVASDFSTGFTDNLWSTRNPAIRSTPWPRDFTQGQGSNAVTAVGGQYSGNPIASGTNAAVLQLTTDPNSWRSYQPGGINSQGISFQTWNPTNE